MGSWFAVDIESGSCKTICSHRRWTESFSFVSDDGDGGDALWIAKPNPKDQSPICRAERSGRKRRGWEDIPSVFDSEEQEQST